ncbi:hypothetical protein Bbelb_254220 [Branchiostoma belcheri]|nr:hypothetical protein Bbelb_254220 [Branchiostoma belcheri]
MGTTSTQEDVGLGIYDRRRRNNVTPVQPRNGRVHRTSRDQPRDGRNSGALNTRTVSPTSSSQTSRDNGRNRDDVQTPRSEEGYRATNRPPPLIPVIGDLHSSPKDQRQLGQHRGKLPTDDTQPGGRIHRGAQLSHRTRRRGQHREKRPTCDTQSADSTHRLAQPSHYGRSLHTSPTTNTSIRTGTQRPGAYHGRGSPRSSRRGIKTGTHVTNLCWLKV